MVAAPKSAVKVHDIFDEVIVGHNLDGPLKPVLDTRFTIPNVRDNQNIFLDTYCRSHARFTLVLRQIRAMGPSLEIVGFVVEQESLTAE